jgi:hypothetical protein
VAVAVAVAVGVNAVLAASATAAAPIVRRIPDTAMDGLDMVFLLQRLNGTMRVCARSAGLIGSTRKASSAGLKVS